MSGASPAPGLVLVVGAGPTGLTAALELARQGVSVRIVDRAHEPSRETRALGMQARTLELLERHGLARDLVRAGLPATRFTVLSEGRPILRADFGTLDTPYPFLLMVPQDRTEAILTERLARLGVRVERGVAVTDLDQDGDGVDVGLVGPHGAHESARVDWVIGADGAHSTVRHQLGLDFVGTSFEESFTVADLRVEWSRPHDEFFAFLDRGRFVAFFPMLGGWHRVAIARPVDDPEEGDVTHDELQRAISACVPGAATLLEVRQAGRFRINQRRAAAYAVGRVFLAGDAAHIHSVVGAQGMNTGIQDAVNLGWKLAAVARGEAPRELLDTYAAERTPVARRLVTWTRRVTRLTLVADPVRTTLRRHVAPLVLGRESVRARLTRAIAQLDVSYHDASGASPAGRVDVGDRAPDAPLRDAVDGGARRVLAAVDDLTHTLLAFDLDADAAQDVAARHGAPVRVVALDREPRAAARYRVTGPAAVLVRPDGYVGHRTDRGEQPGE